MVNLLEFTDIVSWIRIQYDDHEAMLHDAMRAVYEVHSGTTRNTTAVS
jgi:hypothetical protein